MIFNTSTRIAPIVDVSTYYEGPFSYESLWDADEEFEREEGRIVCDDYDFAKLGKRIVEEANKVFKAEKPLEEYGVVSIRATKFGSPREYNFMTDWLDLDVEVDDSFWEKAKSAIFDPGNRTAIVTYTGDHWVTRDGFTSAMLNRVSDLSRDYWKHEHYGTHMATDKEVEDALLADLEDAFAALSTETSDDEFREFGAILALLWLIKYPGDFDRSRSESWSGSWVTNMVVDSLTGNSSLSEFCTVLERDDVKERYPEYSELDADLDKSERDLRHTHEEYVKSDVPDAAKERSWNYLRSLLDVVAGYRREAHDAVANWHPDHPENARDELRELKERWDAEADSGTWRRFWK